MSVRQNLLGHSGIVAVRADASDPAALIRQLNAAFEEFKAANDARLKEIEKGTADVVSNEKVDRINGEITNLLNQIQALEARMSRPQMPAEAERDQQAAVEAMNRNLRAHAQRLSRPLPAEMDAQSFAAYRQAFNRALRSDGRSLSSEVLNALQVGSDPDGGYLCPPEIDTMIDRIVSDLGSIRRLATVRSIGTSSLKKPVQTSGAGFGGWAGERASPTETTTPGLTELEFTPGTMWAEPRATTEFLEDASINVEAWLADEVGLTFVEQESQAFIDGNGVTKPRGFLSYNIVANASYSWGNIGYVASGGASDFATSNPSDKLIDLVHALKRQYRGNATWVMNDATLAAIRKFKDSTGIYLWAPSGLTGGQVGVLLGYPVATDDFMPDVGAGNFPIAFGDFRRGYLIVDRRGTVVVRDNLTSKPYVKFYTTRRVGGGVQNFEAIKVMKIAAS